MSEFTNLFNNQAIPVTGTCSKCDPLSNEPSTYGTCRQCLQPVSAVNLTSLGAVMDLVNKKLWDELEK